MDAAEILHAAGINSLPTDMERIAEHFGIKIVSYSSVSDIFEKSMAELYAISRHGYSFSRDGVCVCAINENACGESRRRWTIAHEVSHCLLGHTAGETHDIREERAADELAAGLLCPLAVVNFCGVSSAGELMRLCRISRQAAAIRFRELTAWRREMSARCAGDHSRTLNPSELVCVSDFSGFICRRLMEKSRRDGSGESFPHRGDRIVAFR